MGIILHSAYHFGECAVKYRIEKFIYEYSNDDSCDDEDDSLGFTELVIMHGFIEQCSPLFEVECKEFFQYLFHILQI